MSARHAEIVALVRKGHERRDEPFLLACGESSRDYIDGKFAIADGRALRLVSEAIIAAAGSDFTAVGGLTMGADALAHGVAVVHGCRWFSVRKEPKGRGLDKWVEGARLHGNDRVLLVDDVVTTGNSIAIALGHVKEEAHGAQVVGAVALMDRGEATSRLFTEYGIPYTALVTYRDLGIEPVNGPQRPAPAR